MWCVVFVFFFKQKTAYELRISDWSSDVCSSDLAAQDLHRLAHGRLDDVDLLEAPRQRVVLLEDPTVLLERGRADAAQVARRQRRLDHVAGVHRAARRRAGADDGVELVEEQQDRKSVGWGKTVSVRVDLGVARNIK